MKTVSIGKLRQNPAPAIEEVEHGHAVEITRYRKVIARIVPAGRAVQSLSGSELMKQAQTLRRQPADPNWTTDIAAARVQDQTEWSDPWEES